MDTKKFSGKTIKGKHFYSHLVETSSLSLALGDIEMTQEERVELTELAHDNIHHSILERLLKELSEKDKKMFLLHLSRGHHDKIWEVLKKNARNAEKIIQETFEEVKKELLADIQNSSKK